MKSSQTLIITGPTASGKTRLAVELARKFRGEIISADCRQVYRGLDIGTGKDLDEYGTPSNHVPYHLIDICEPEDEFNLLRFVQLATVAINDISERGFLPIIAGGTPLYLSALLNGYDLPGGKPDPELRAELESLTDDELIAKLHSIATPQLLSRVDTTQRKRIIRAIEIAMNPEAATPASKPLSTPLILAPFYDRATIRQRIMERLDLRLNNGLVEEVQNLHQQGVSWERLDWYGLEYRYVSKYLRGTYTFQQMRDKLLNKIRNFAKSQDIWFRKLERQGHVIHWIPNGDFNMATSLVSAWLSGHPLPPPEIVLDNIHYGAKQ